MVTDRPPQNIFNVLGDFAGDVADIAQEDLENLRKHEEQMAALKIQNTLEAEATEHLLKQQQEYSFDGNLERDATEFLTERIGELDRQIENKNVRQAFQRQTEIYKGNYQTKAKEIEIAKHREKQGREWDQYLAQDIAEISLANGDIETLQRKIAKWQAGEDNFFGDVKDKLLPSTLASLTKSALNAQLDKLEVQIAQRQLNPKQAAAAADVLLKEVVGNTEAFKLQPNDVAVYVGRINAAKEKYLTKGAAAHKKVVDKQYKDAKELVDKGQLSINSPEYQDAVANRADYLEPGEENAFQAEVLATDIRGNAAIFVNNGDTAKANATANELLQLSERAKKAGNFTLANDYLSYYQSTKEYISQRDKLYHTDQGVFFSNDPIVQDLFANSTKGSAVQYVIDKVDGDVNLSVANPIPEYELDSVTNRLQATGADSGAFETVAAEIFQEYDFQLSQGGNAQEFLFKQLKRNVTKDKNIDDAYSLNELKVLALEYAGDPNFKQIFNAITDASNPDSPLKSDDAKTIETKTLSKMRKYVMASRELNDVDTITTPGHHGGPLIQAIAKGLKKKDPTLSNGTAVDNAIKMTLDKKYQVVTAVGGENLIRRDTPQQAVKAIQDKTFTKRFILEKLDGGKNLDFPTVYSLDGNLVQNVTKNAVKTNGVIRQFGDKYRLYLKFGLEAGGVMQRNAQGTPVFIEIPEAELIDAYQKEMARRSEGLNLGVFPRTRTEI